MVKNFKGLVRISDVQEEFDKLITSLNNSVDEYNNIEAIQNIDYNKAGSNLGQLGYTLTVGGLKQFMKIYDGCCFGVRVMRTSGLNGGLNACIPTQGILITENKIYRIPSEVVEGYGSILYFNPTTNKCQVAGSSKVFKSFTQPNITSNNSWGSFSASAKSGNAFKSTKTLSFSDINSLNNVWDGIIFTRDASKQNILEWRFKNKIRLANISFSIFTAMLYPYAHSFSITVTDLSGKILFSSTGRNSINGDWNIPISNITTSGIRIIAKGAITSGNNGGGWLGNLKIAGTQEVTVSSSEPEEGLYKIADLNWEKTTGDKLWLNDLPNTMV